VAVRSAGPGAPDPGRGRWGGPVAVGHVGSVGDMDAAWSTALVTGASSGIGAAVAAQLAEQGVDMVLVARRGEVLERLATTLVGHGSRIEVLVADLAEAAGRELVVSRLQDPERGIDLLVNSAGVGLQSPFADGDPERYQQMIELNVTAVVELTRAAVPPMRDRGFGWVLNVSSLGGHAPGPGVAVYSATKAFVTSFSESLHEELRREGVVVTALCPGATRTEFGEISGTTADDLPDMLWQTAEEVAIEGLAALAAGKAVRVTGVPNRVAASLSAVLPRVAKRRWAGMVTDRL